jgi:hypothetical protein
VPFPFLALAATAVQTDQQAKAGGGAGLFELNSLFRGPQAGDQYGAFKPGGMYAPPSIEQFKGVASGRDVGATIGAALAPGIGQAIASLISGPGRGNQRRASARQLVTSSPELLGLQRRLLAPGAFGGFTPADIQALTPIVSEANALGGLGSKYGERANMLQDVVKFLFTGETSKPKRPYPVSLTDLVAVINAATVAAPAASPPLAPTQPVRTLPASYSAPVTRTRITVLPRVSTPVNYWAGLAYTPRFA